MTMPQDSDYEFVEVKVSRKIDIHLSLDDLITALQGQATALAAAGNQVDTQIAARLNQLTQLAHQLKTELPGSGH